jgi:hypothetical protein
MSYLLNRERLLGGLDTPKIAASLDLACGYMSIQQRQRSQAAMSHPILAQHCGDIDLFGELQGPIKSCI